jgi:hypothetical protein
VRTVVTLTVFVIDSLARVHTYIYPYINIILSTNWEKRRVRKKNKVNMYLQFVYDDYYSNF